MLFRSTGEKFADFYKEGIFTAVKPINNFDFKTFSGGTWQVGARYSTFDASDFNNTTFASVNGATTSAANGSVTTTNTTNSTFEADAYTVGINFLPTPNTRFMLNFIQTNFDTPILIEGDKEDKERAITARAQFNF